MPAAVTESVATPTPQLLIPPVKMVHPTRAVRVRTQKERLRTTERLRQVRKLDRDRSLTADAEEHATLTREPSERSGSYSWEVIDANPWCGFDEGPGFTD